MSLFSMEQIFFQTNDPFKESLINLVRRIYSEIDYKKVKTNSELIQYSPLIKELVKLIKDRFNLTVIMDNKLSNYISAAVIPFSSDYMLSAKDMNQFNSSYFSELFGSTSIFTHLKKIEKEKETIYKRIHNRKGFVDFKGARVGGYLADVRHFLVINFFTLKDEGLNESETAAVICHEIGHIFDGLTTHYKMATSNSAIMDTVNQLNENKTEKAYYTFKRNFGPEDLEEAKLDKDSKITDFYGPLVIRYMKELGNTIHNSKYDKTNYEAMADSFAVRLGFGEHLLTGLDKVYARHGISPYQSKQYFYIAHMVEVMSVVFLLTCLGVIGLALVVTVFSFFAGTHKRDFTYDVPYDRFNRIRNGVISNLKDKHLPLEYTEELLKQMVFIDSVMNNSNNFKSISNIIADYIKPKSKETAAYIEIQQTIENSLNNNLFHSSAKIRVL